MSGLKSQLVLGFTALVAIAGCSSGGGHSGGGSGSASIATGNTTGTGTVTSGSGGGSPNVNPGSPSAGNLGLGRAWHTATTLPSGAVFVAGGVDAGGQALNLTALVTPTSVVLGPTMYSPRFGHTATLLGNGMVLIAGGQTGTLAGSQVLESTELYDPAANAMLQGPNMQAARTDHFAVVYGPIGSQYVLIGGGSSNGLAALNSAELYNVATNSIGAAPNYLAASVMNAQACLMDDGTVFIAGGTNSTGTVGAELFNPSNNSFTSISMTNPVVGGAFCTNGSEAILAGGQAGSAQIEQTSSVYSAATQTINSGPLLSVARRDASACLVNSSQVLVIGGRTSTGVSGVIDILSGPTIIGSTVSSGSSLATPRYGHTANVIPTTGQVLVIGGFDGTATPLASIEVVTVTGSTSSGSTASTGTLPTNQGVPISITPVPSTSVIPSAGASNSTGSLISGLIGGLLGNLFGLNTSSNAGLTPSITSVNQTSGPAGTVVVIQATGIGAYLSVALDNGTGSPIFLTNAECTAYQNGSSVQLSWTVQSGLVAGTYNVDLITSSYQTTGSAAAMAQCQFTVN